MGVGWLSSGCSAERNGMHSHGGPWERVRGRRTVGTRVCTASLVAEAGGIHLNQIFSILPDFTDL
jgi:hypothetical protein